MINVSTGTVERTVVNRSLGAFVYERGNTIITYQGGGVWRKSEDSNASIMVSKPESHYRGTTLTLPIVQVSGNASGSPGSVTVTEDGSHVIENHTNPLTDTDKTVHVTVSSAYYKAWGDYFNERTEGTVAYDHDNRTTTLQLVTAVEKSEPVKGAITSAASGEAIDLDNNVIVNAYNSSSGESPNPNGVSANHQGGTIRVAGTLKANSGNVRIVSNVSARGDVIFDNTNVRMPQGDVRCASGNHGCVEDNVPYDPIENGTEVNTSTDIELPEPVTNLVMDKLDTIEHRNDNDDTENVSGDRLNWSNKNGDTLVLESGTYHLSKVEMTNTGNQKLVLDTSKGDIELAIDGDFHLDGTKIVVRGNSGAVRVFADISSDHQHGSTNGDMDFTGGIVEVQDANGTETFESPRFWVYAPAGITADLKRGSRGTDFTGVIYAPDESGATGAVQVTSSAVSGAIVAHLEQAGHGSNQAQISFDEALLNEMIVGQSSNPNNPRVTFMHISVYTIEITT